MGCFYWHGNFSAIKINAIKNNDYKLFCLSRHTRLDYLCGKPTVYSMVLIINGQQAVLKKGSSMEYISDNLIFTNA